MARFRHSMDNRDGVERKSGGFRSLGVWCLACLLGCSAGGGSIVELTQAIEPHEKEFKRFETWVQRALTTVQLGTSDEVAMEALFGPVRHRGSVLFTQVQYGGRRERVWSLPAKAELSGDVVWRRLRLADGAEPVQVATAQVCPIKVPAWWRNGRGAGPCVLIASEHALSRTETIRVTVAFEATLSP